MRFTYLTTAYPAYLKLFYKRRPELRQAPFADQYAALLEDGFAWHGAWSAALPQHGYEVQEIIANATPLQFAWARENNCPLPALRSKTAIALRQVEQWNPDVVLIDNLVVFTGGFIAQLRQRCPRVRVVLGFSGSESYDLDTLGSLDVLLSPIRSYISRYENMGYRARYLPHAFNSAVLRQLPNRAPVDEVVIFVGGLIRASGYHFKREQLLEEIVQVLPLRIFSSQAELTPLGDLLDTGMRRALYYLMQLLGASGVPTDKLRRLPVIGRASLWKHAPLRQINTVLYPQMSPALYGKEFYETQRKSAVTLNVQGDNALQEAVNMRLFEVTGVGGCLLTDAKNNLGELFEIDREIVTFNSAAECVEKARWLLDHPAEREAIAQAGHRRTMRDHTFSQRGSMLVAIIQEFLVNGPRH